MEKIECIFLCREKDTIRHCKRILNYCLLSTAQDSASWKWLVITMHLSKEIVDGMACKKDALKWLVLLS